MDLSGHPKAKHVSCVVSAAMLLWPQALEVNSTAKSHGSYCSLTLISDSLVTHHAFPAHKDGRWLRVALLVMEQLGVLREVSAAAGTQEQLLGRVRSAVGCKLRLPIEEPAAVTGELALSTVDELVLEEVLGPSKGLAALRAVVHFPVGVGLAMSNEAGAGVEAPATHIAAVRLLAGVGAPVDDQSSVVPVELAALQTRVEFDAESVHGLMSGVSFDGSEHLITLGAIGGS